MLSQSGEFLLVILAAGIALSRFQPLLWFSLMATISADLLVVSGAGPAIHMFRLIALFSLPFWIRDLRAALASKPTRVLLVYWIYLLALGVLFGYIIPWQDLSGQRSWTQQAPGRAVVSLSRHAIDFVTAAVALLKLRDQRNHQWAVRGLAVGLFANTGVAILDYFLGGRLAQPFVIASLPDVVRQGGLNIEPRALARYAVLATAICYFSTTRPLYRLLLLATGAIAVGLAQSLSAVGAALTGTLAAAGWSLANNRNRQAIAWLSAAVSLAAIVLMSGGGALPEAMRYRLDSARDSTDRDFSESRLTATLEVFDRAAVRFLSQEPIFAMLGTGPDLISLPASDHLALGAMDVYGFRIDSVPHSGMISTLANAGIPGLILMAAFVFYAAAHANRIPDQRERSAAVVFIAGFSALVMTPLFYFTLVMLVHPRPTRDSKRNHFNGPADFRRNADLELRAIHSSHPVRSLPRRIASQTHRSRRRFD